MTNSKYKFVRVSLIIFACILSSMLLFMPFLLKDKRSVFADTSVTDGYVFTSSNIYLPVAVFNNNGDWSNSVFLDSEGPSCFSFVLDSNSFNCSLTYKIVTSTSTSQLLVDTFPISLGSEGFRYLTLYPNSDISYLKTPFWYHFDTNFNFNVVSLTIEHYDSFGGQSYLGSHMLNYYDTNGSVVKFLFPYKTIARYPILDNRTYFFSDNLNLSDSAYYRQGVSDGYNNGFSVGDSQGYDRGYNNGYSVGERTGFNDGVASANDYSFLGLFGAIVDAPLQAFTGLFDFNLSFDGVHNFNLKGFFLAMLTIAIIVAIIRFAMSR